MEEKPLINRVANSGLINLNLEEYYPSDEFYAFDIKPFLYMELILKEKDFRQALKEFDWSKVEGKIVLVYCSADAIVPVWAYMLVSAYATENALEVFQGTEGEYLKFHFQKCIDAIDPTIYDQKRVVIKGCSEKSVPASAYSAITSRLRPYAQSIMYGEPCSTVPVFKRPRILKK